MRPAVAAGLVTTKFCSETNPRAARPSAEVNALNTQVEPARTVFARVAEMSPTPLTTAEKVIVEIACQKSPPILAIVTPTELAAPLRIFAVAPAIPRSVDSAINGLVDGPSRPSRPRTRPVMFVFPEAKSTSALVAMIAFRPSAIRPSGPPTKIATTVIASTIQPKISQKTSQADFFGFGERMCSRAPLIVAAAVPAAVFRSVPAWFASAVRVSRRESPSARPAASVSAPSARDCASRSAEM
ncbi:hypothetical protein [Frankia sp. CcI49]|uniref:hypothetical protein n=1 Tax=Frankia sp. CcI49 TaxID=1745382 RepID=UPI001054BF8F|nr:hypothetical protein [Frankia sp. CcI49]